uniref:Mutator-like transposase domain-containing protein n=1 Tax=Homalodisca liturata TaxID=320908 RepID=A0A1B6I8W1_9HEMI
MNMSPPPSKFLRYTNVLLKSVEKASTDSMTTATHDAVVGNGGNSDICVAVDGTWQKRGHTSKHGVITMTGKMASENGKVWDVLSLSKYCPVCKNEKKIMTIV